MPRSNAFAAKWPSLPTSFRSTRGAAPRLRSARNRNSSRQRRHEVEIHVPELARLCKNAGEQRALAYDHLERARTLLPRVTFRSSGGIDEIHLHCIGSFARILCAGLRATWRGRPSEGAEERARALSRCAAGA